MSFQKPIIPVDPDSAIDCVWQLPTPENRHLDFVDCCFRMFYILFYIRNGRRDIADRGCCDCGADDISYVCTRSAMQK